MNTRQFAAMSAGIQLQDILPEAKPVGSPNVIVHSACGQWNECEPNDVFVAVNGSEADGHDYACQAVERGAMAAVGERLMPIQKPQFLVDDSRIAYGTICQALAGNPSQHLSTIGVAGTDGKTVTAHLLDSILRHAGRQPGLLTSIQNPFQVASASDTTDVTPPVAAERLSKMVLGQCTHAVVETSSTTLAQHAWTGISLDAAVLTNVRRGNLESHGSIANYRRANSRVLDYLKPSGFAVVNADDNVSRQLLDECSAPTLTFGIHHAAEVTAKLLDRHAAFQTFLLTAGNESIAVRTRIIGKQHVYNCLAAAATAVTFGIDLELIAQGLEAACIPGRLERIDCGQSFGVWIDSASTPNQLTSAIGAIGRVCEGRLWCIASTDAVQSVAQRRRIGEILERQTEKSVICQSTTPANLDYEAAHQVLDGFDNPATTRIVPNRFQAIEWVLTQAREKDAVLIAGCGEKRNRVGSDSELTMSDREFCQAWLSDQADSEPESDGNIYNIQDFR